MINILASCNHCGCVSGFVLDENAIWITGIICFTIFVTVVFCFFFLYKNSKKRLELETEKKQIEDRLNKMETELKETEGKINNTNSKLSNEEKKAKEFLDYCYKMAKSLDKGNEKQKEDCWKIILYNHANCISDELKKEYKIDKN